MDITSLQQAYKDKATSPTEVVKEIYAQIRRQGERPVWITLIDEEEKSRPRTHARIDRPESKSLRLYGIPFAVKDNFDVAGLPTTAACPEFSHQARATAEAVRRLLDAGAILIGKTNMDQFATGLVGTRTPYGICSSVFSSEHISGGSSPGSAVAVAQGLVSFSLWVAIRRDREEFRPLSISLSDSSQRAGLLLRTDFFPRADLWIVFRFLRRLVLMHREF